MSSSRRPLAQGVLAVVLLGACGANEVPVAAPRPPREELVVVAAPADAAPASPSPETTRGPADDAVRRLATKLEDVAKACGTHWTEASDLCAEASFAEIAVTYQAHYATSEDPLRNQGRIDALPRLGGRDATVESVTARISVLCNERCDLARRTSLAEVRAEAVEACAGKAGRPACALLAQRVPANATGSVKTAVTDCERACDDRRRDARAAAERERNRPRTEAQSHLCFRACMSRCTGGRVVPALDGTFKPDPDDFCGTCQMTCGWTCAVR
jgi:hypothetical protein